MKVTENLSDWSPLKKWIYALKVKSWPKLIVPFAFGQLFGIHFTLKPSAFVFLIGFIFTASLLGYIVLLNDYADIEVDTIKRNLFPKDCSPKTIPDKILPKNQVLFVGLFFAIVCITSAVFLELYLNRSFIIIFSLLCVLTFAAYSLPPIRLNYRGGGEFLEMIGVGLMLPAFHFYLQAGLNFPLSFLLLLTLSTIFALTSALASGLSDEESDRLGGKTTFVTGFGNPKTRSIINVLILLGYILFLLFCIFYSLFSSVLICSLLTFFTLYHIFFILKLSKSAITNAFESQRVYKDHLHKMIWGLFLFSGILIHFDKSKYLF